MAVLFLTQSKDTVWLLSCRGQVFMSVIYTWLKYFPRWHVFPENNECWRCFRISCSHLSVVNIASPPWKCLKKINIHENHSCPVSCFCFLFPFPFWRIKTTVGGILHWTSQPYRTTYKEDSNDNNLFGLAYLFSICKILGNI